MLHKSIKSGKLGKGTLTKCTVLVAKDVLAQLANTKSLSVIGNCESKNHKATRKLR